MLPKSENIFSFISAVSCIFRKVFSADTFSVVIRFML